MHGEVLQYHTTLRQVVEIELLLQRLHHDELLLASIKLLKKRRGAVLERQLNIKLLHARFNLEPLSHLIDLRVVKVDDHSN